MPRSRGQIPPYGENFHRETVSYDRHLASTVYVLKRDARWFIRSDKTSHVWTVFYQTFAGPLPMGYPVRTFTEAMTRLLDGIALGFYHAA
jgi:hypothetical protein